MWLRHFVLGVSDFPLEDRLGLPGSMACRHESADSLPLCLAAKSPIVPVSNQDSTAAGE